MDLLNYIGKRVKIELKNNFLYEGDVLTADEDSLTIKDKFGKIVCFSLDSILFIREVDDDPKS